ncbi:MAG: helix-turn-helix domain-containing protein [Desulfobacteraceae bacterium]|nr:helix-turn-helix domain-containing protein [Desulfobacteraceae bacterium]
MQKEENFMNDVEAAEFLNLSPQTLRNWRTQSRGPAYSKAGRAIRYALDDLRAYMEKNRVNNDG